MAIIVSGYAYTRPLRDIEESLGIYRTEEDTIRRYEPMFDGFPPSMQAQYRTHWERGRVEYWRAKAKGE